MAEFRPDLRATKDTSTQGLGVQSEWGSGINGYLPGPAVHTGLGGASLDPFGPAAEGHGLGLN